MTFAKINFKLARGEMSCAICVMQEISMRNEILARELLEKKVMVAIATANIETTDDDMEEADSDDETNDPAYVGGVKFLRKLVNDSCNCSLREVARTTDETNEYLMERDIELAKLDEVSSDDDLTKIRWEIYAFTNRAISI